MAIKREYGEFARVGLIVPPANPVAEPELRRLIPDAITLHVARMPVIAAPDLKDRVDAYVRTLDGTARSFGAMELDAVAFAFAAASYLVGRNKESMLLDTLRADRDVPAISVASAVVDFMRHHDGKKMIAVSPYPVWLNDLAADYWKQADIDVREVISVAPPKGAIYELTSDDVMQALTDLKVDDDSVVMVVGTGFASLRILRDASQLLDVPVLSYNSCLARAVRNVFDA